MKLKDGYYCTNTVTCVIWYGEKYDMMEWIRLMRRDGFTTGECTQWLKDHTINVEELP